MKLPWRRTRSRNAVLVKDDEFWRPVVRNPDERPWYELHSNLQLARSLYRTNPLAARIIGMTTDFTIGRGIRLTGDPFCTRFWHDPENHMDSRIYTMSDELSRAGELFIAFFTRVDGMQYIREIPAHTIDTIDSDPNDYENELSYHQVTTEPEGRTWPSVKHADNNQPAILHFTINRPVGENRGYSDLHQVSKWLARYDEWLEDRVRINRYKGAFLWHVTIDKALPGILETKRNQYSRIPSPGSVIVSDSSEHWTPIKPEIAADDAEPDGKALRLMIAAGTGIPLHFLAEGETATRATAREMGTATYRHFVTRQHTIETLLDRILTTAARRAGQPAPDYALDFESVLSEDYRANEEQSNDTTPNPPASKPS